MLRAEAELRPSQLQDLADIVGDVVGAAVGYELKFRVVVELGGETEPPGDVVEKLNRSLGEVSEELKLR